ncbi:MAG TPA: radical SAM protein [Chloroflexi bacterium]|jgi:anaerobic magnesium-protoporphyrin IX monomethyl ester cyclase|nr:radical SAM protein [Chloroflexota bacterium]
MNAQRSVQPMTASNEPGHALDVLLVNPPAPDGGIWIRSQHRVGRRSREGMLWAQVELAQLAALLHPYYSVEIIDAIADHVDWPTFAATLRRLRPRYYVTQATAPTLTNDMYGVFLARSLGARTIAFGTHVTPMAQETMEAFPALDFVLQGEPELTLRELVDVLEERETPRWVQTLLRTTDPEWSAADGPVPLAHVKGLVWRRDGEITTNAPRPLIANLDALPLPLHRLLPLERYRMPLLGGPYSFVVTSRGCPAGCRFCIKHVTYGQCVRVRSADNIVQELRELDRLGVQTVHMYADLFTVNREQVMALCQRMREANLRMRWTCNSRVDFVDPELLATMAQAGCWLISWGIESANEGILRRIHKGYRPEQAEQALRWAREAGIKNWGYFIIGLPGETEETIDQTIALAKRLPLDLALFHIAAPHPGTPFYREVIEQGWIRPGAAWEDVDMDRSTVLAYPHLSAEQLESHAQRAFREWALRPGPIWTFIKSINSLSVVRSALDIGLQQLAWITTRHPGQ